MKANIENMTKGTGLTQPKPLTVADYLRLQQQAKALKKLPHWMPSVEDDIAQLRQRYDNVISLLYIVIAIAIAALLLVMGSVVIGGVV